MFERFTQDARRVVVRAQEQARRLGHDQVGAGHLLLAVTSEAGADASADASADAGAEASAQASADAAHGMAELLAGLGVNTELVEATLRARGPSHGIDAEALRSFGIDLDQIVAAVEQRFGRGAFDRAGASASRWPLRRSRFGGGQIRFSDDAKKALELSLREAVNRGDRELTVAHVLLGLLRTGSPTVEAVLAAAGISAQVVRQLVLDRLRRCA